MRSATPILACLLVLGLIPAIPLAGSTEQPTPESRTLWAHNLEDAGEMIMSPVRDDPRSVGTSPAGDPSGAGTDTTTWTIPLDPVLAHTLVLDPDGDVTFNLRLGSNQGAGSVEVETRLELGGEIVAQGDPQEVTYVPGDVTDYANASWTVSAQLDRLEAGKDLVWIVEATGPRTAIFMGMGGDRRSNIELPIVEIEGDDGPETLYALHEDAVLEIEATSDEARTRLNVHNWTQGPVDLSFAFTSEIENGTLSLTITDGENNTVDLPAALPDEITESLDITGNLTSLAPGDWTIEIQETDFVGTYSLTAQTFETEDEEETDEDDDGTVKTTANDDDNGTDDPEEKGALPGPGIVLVVAVTAIGVAALRRIGATRR